MKTKKEHVVRTSVWSEKGSLIVSVVSNMSVDQCIDIIENYLYGAHIETDVVGVRSMSEIAVSVVVGLRNESEDVRFCTNEGIAPTASIDIYQKLKTSDLSVSVTEFDSKGLKTTTNLKLYENLIEHDEGDVIEFAYQPTERSASKWRRITLVDSDELHVNGLDHDDQQIYKSFRIDKIIGGVGKIFKAKIS